MTDERWCRVKSLFQAAVEFPTGERDAFLAAATGEDETLRREVASLLIADAADAGFFNHLAVGSVPGLAEPFGTHPALIDHPPSPVVFTPGLRVGHYEIVAPLGAGGMGEVYRAYDTKLNRQVALKVLPELFAGDPDRRARFTREAQLLATLNHPNIAAIYGLEESEPGSEAGPRALVLELVDGPTLADRIAVGPIPREEALTIASQIALALEAAHEKGIIHRDLKPANIKIAGNGVVKVLDLGLAKVWDGAPESAVAGSPKLTATQIGAQTILGTPAYMSPEQARGTALDRRTDIWSFGCVLYEMLTGRAAFAGETISDTLAAILERQPDRTLLPADTPEPIHRLLRRCLEKDRRRRLDSAAGARLEMDDATTSPSGEAPARAVVPFRRLAPASIVMFAGGAVVAALVTWIMLRPGPAAPRLPSRFGLTAASAAPLNVSLSDRDLAISPDGRYFIYHVGGDLTVGGGLMVRALDQLDASLLPGIVARGVFSSTNGQWVGFFTNRELRKVSIAGGPAVALGPVTGASLGASWGDDDTIVFATDDPKTGLCRLPANGGEPTVLTTPDTVQGERDHGFPSVLPGGRAVLFTIMAARPADRPQVAVLDLTTGRRKTLVGDGSQAEYIDASPGTDHGYLLYAAAGTLRAVRFDPKRLEVIGDPVTAVDGVMIKPSGAANFAVSRQGTLVYVRSGVSVQMTPRSLVWVDRKGHEEPITVVEAAYGPPRVSPDGSRVVFSKFDQENTDIWIWDLARETLKRLTFLPGTDGMPLWTPDSQRIIFTSDRTGVFNLYSQAADGTDAVDRLTTSANQQFPTSIAPDGSFVVGTENVSMAATQMVPGLAWRVMLYPPTSPRGSPTRSTLPGSRPSLAEPRDQILFDGGWGEISPDGRYIAYQSAPGEPGRPEVYVRPFPQVDSGRWQISTTGGTRPAWARSGRELFYLDGSNTLTAVSVRRSASTFIPGKPEKVLAAQYAEPFPPRSYDVSPDGQRFLMLKDSAPNDHKLMPTSMVVVQHWLEELQQRLPMKAP